MSSCNCNEGSLLNGADAIVIIGANAEAFIYASILIKYKIPIPIFILVPGVNHIDKYPYLDDASFPINNLRYKIAFLNPTKIRYSTPGYSVFNSIADYQALSNISLLYTGQGPCGNYIFAPPMDFGPWLDNELENNANSFLENVTVPTPYTAVEAKVTQYIQNLYNLPTYNAQNQGVYHAAVTYHHRFLRGQSDNKGNYRRNYLQYFYNVIKQAEGKCNSTPVKIYTEVTQIAFSPGINAGLYNLSFMAGHTNKVIIDNATVTWKTFHNVYQQIAVQGGLNPNRSRTPTSYRAVIPMSLIAAGLNTTIPDQLTITSRATFSLPDLSSGDQSVLCWLVSYYTTQQDIVTDHIADITNPADPQCLLIVEALCRGNQRDLGYNLYAEQNEVTLNNPEFEARFMCDFRTIVGSIYTGYTGLVLPNYPNTAEVCQNGTCITNKYFTSQPPTQILPLIALNTLVAIYDSYLEYRAPGANKVFN